MKPLNETEKKKATNKFIVLLILLLLLVFGAAYLLFSSPLNIYKEELRGKTDFLAQNDTIINKASRISQKIMGLRQSEDKYSNGSLNPEEENNIRNLLASIRLDYTKLVEDSNTTSFPPVKKSLTNYLIAYNAVLDYGSNGQELRKSNYEYRQAISTKGDGGVNILQTQLTICQSKNDDLAKQLQEAKSSGKSGGGGVAVLPPVPAGALTAAEAQKLREQLAQTEKDRDGYKSTAADLDEKLKQAKNVPAPAGPGCSEADKAKAMYSAAESLCNKAQQSRGKDKPGYYISALEILKSPKMQNYDDKQKLNDKIAEINRILIPAN